MDWREPGAGKRLNGAKAEDYQAAGYAYGPREAPFASVEELQLVMGMTPAVFARIAPVLTIASQTPTVDPQVAPQAVLLALPGADADGVTELLRERAERHQQNEPANNMQSGSLIGHALRITATAQGASQAFRMRTMELRATGLTASPFWVYSAG
jgi:general secretion pathway protein K